MISRGADVQAGLRQLHSSSEPNRHILGGNFHDAFRVTDKSCNTKDAADSCHMSELGACRQGSDSCKQPISATILCEVTQVLEINTNVKQRGVQPTGLYIC